MKSRKTWPGFCILCMLLILIVSGCKNNNSVSKRPNPSVSEIPQPGYDTQILGVVKEVDDKLHKIKIYDTVNKMEIDLSYTGGTDITDQYEQVISISKISPGELVDIFFDTKEAKLVKLQISKDAWEYQGVNNLIIDENLKIMEIADRKYKYTEDCVVAGPEGLKSIMEISSEDELTVKGKGGMIYSIIVTKGHGYIRLKGQDAFIGGYLETGYNIFAAVTENMLLTVREGQYDVRLRNGELSGSRTVTVRPDEESVADFSQFHIEPDRIGKMKFIITPKGADLYINGTLTEYADPIDLVYGKHDIKVSLTGYEEYNGRLAVGSAYEDIIINLAAETASVSDEDGNVTIEGENGDQNEVTGQTGQNTDKETSIENTTPSPTPASANENDEDSQGQVGLDENHNITIKNPVGAQVYVNGTYKGTTPLTFPKMTGKLTITFCREGYNNSSYSVDLEDNGEDVTLMFPDLTESNG